MVYSVVFEHKLDGTTTYKAYDTIQGWVHIQGAKVKENHRPNLIVASHGSPKQKLPWEKNARKTLRFELAQQESDVLVKVHVSPHVSPEKEPSLIAREADARRNWNQLLSSLWSRLGGEATQETASPMPEDVGRSMKRGRRMISVGTALSVFGLIFSFVVPTTLTGVAIIASSMGIILMINGYMAVRSATKRLSSTRR